MPDKKIRSETGRLTRSRSGSVDRSMDAVLSTSGIALDGHRVLGWEYPKTVPLVDTHRDRDGVRNVIGRVTPRRDGRRLLGRLDFATADVNPDAEVAFRLCEAGYVDSVSVSFVPVEWEYAKENGRAPGAMDISMAKLLETSVCAVGSDENAKILARAVRRKLSGRETREDRLARAQAILRRIRLEDEEYEARMRHHDLVRRGLAY
jgi:HK97 family phage prohead protease